MYIPNIADLEYLNSEPEMNDFMRRVGINLVLKWQEFGYELHLSRQVIQRIQADNERQSSALAFVREVFHAWTVLTSGRLTWAEIIRALQSPTVNEVDCAREVQSYLRTKHQESH